MSNYGSWSVKGIDDRARAVAKEKARLEGVTLGDYINGLLLKGHSEAGPRDLDSFIHSGGRTETSLDGLTRRIEAAEARSTLAITGIDQSVLGLLARLENTEHTSSAMAAEVESIIDELRETHEALQSKVHQIEADDTADQNLQAVKALEDALGKLASHVYEESGLAQDETSAIKGRIESGFSELSERVEGMDVKIESTLADAAKRVEKAVEQSELRAEGTSRHLSERFTAIESGVATKLAIVADVDTRMTAVEGDVSGAITSMEGTLVRIQERLNRAENTTDAALKALEHTFASLDERIESVAVHANPERAEALRQQFEERFEGLAADLRASIEETRAQLADEIEQAAAGDNPELVGRLESTIVSLKERLSSGEERSSRALEAVSQQVGRISTGLDTRLRNIEKREDHVLEQVSAQMDTLTERLDERVAQSEHRSASAIEQVGEQVASAFSRVQARQESAAKAVEDTIAATKQHQDARLSKALSNISERLSDMQSQTVSFVSPVQKAIASLAARLEAVEDFTAPPHSAAPQRDMPDIPAPEILDMTTSIAPDVEADMQDVSEPEAKAAPISETSPEPGSDTSDGSDFIAGLPGFDQPAQSETAGDLPPVSTAVDEDYTAATPEPRPDYTADIEMEPNPLAALGITQETDFSPWGDGRDETRDNDIFADDFPDIPDPESDLPPDAVEDIDAAEDEDPASALTVDEDATDFLARARRAAISAASGTGLPQDGKHASSASDKRKRAAARASGSGSKHSGKLPLMAAVSMLALTSAAGASAFVLLRGKQDIPDTSFKVATATFISPQAVDAALTSSAATDTDAPALVDDAVDAELFGEETGPALDAPEAAETISAAVTTAPRQPLPVIAKGLTLQRAANEGGPIAQYQWGEARLAVNDYTQGPDFIRRAAQQGLPAAQYRLAKLHEKGLGVPRDLIQARVWTEKAARGGNIKAMHDLAVFYADGEGGPQSYAGAAEWFRKAADFGLVDSQYNLAVLYENGLGISPSQTEALYWYEIAARNGDPGAPGNISELRDALSLENAQSAQRRATTWTPSAAIPASNGQFDQQSWQTGTRAQIIAVQTVLNGLGYETGTPDGIAGPGTRTAIREFQTDAGLPTNGQVSDTLVEALNKQAQGAI